MRKNRLRFVLYVIGSYADWITRRQLEKVIPKRTLDRHLPTLLDEKLILERKSFKQPRKRGRPNLEYKISEKFIGNERRISSTVPWITSTTAYELRVQFPG